MSDTYIPTNVPGDTQIPDTYIPSSSEDTYVPGSSSEDTKIPEYEICFFVGVPCVTKAGCGKTCPQNTKGTYLIKKMKTTTPRKNFPTQAEKEQILARLKERADGSGQMGDAGECGKTPCCYPEVTNPEFFDITIVDC